MNYNSPQTHSLKPLNGKTPPYRWDWVRPATLAILVVAVLAITAIISLHLG
jgi:hypothetical protein